MDTSACGNLFQYHKQYEGGFFFKLHHNAFQYNFFFICNWAEISFNKWEKWGGIEIRSRLSNVSTSVWDKVTIVIV